MSDNTFDSDTASNRRDTDQTEPITAQTSTLSKIGAGCWQVTARLCPFFCTAVHAHQVRSFLGNWPLESVGPMGNLLIESSVTFMVALASSMASGVHWAVTVPVSLTSGWRWE